MNEKSFFVYIMASQRNGTLYIGVTSNLPKRVYEHKSKIHAGFSKEYGTDMLVYFEPHADAEHAIMREKAMKKWRRSWKLELIEGVNPSWRDLSMDF